MYHKWSSLNWTNFICVHEIFSLEVRSLKVRKWLKYQKSYIFLTSNWRTWRKFCQSWPFKNSNLLVPIRCSKSIIFSYSTAWLLARYQPRFGQGNKSEVKSTSRNKTSSTFQFGIIYHQRKDSKSIGCPTIYFSDDRMKNILTPRRIVFEPWN